MGYYGFGYGGGDGLWLLLLLGVMVLGMVASAGVQKAFTQFDQMPSRFGQPACVLARQLLRQNGSTVTVERVGGSLTDHYNPRTGVVGLSQSVHDSASVAALAVAAHEIGHVLQYEQGYLPIRIRNTILPAANFGSNAAPFIVLLGLLFHSYTLSMIGVILFGAMLLFQLVTLPVEFNASSRALYLLETGGYLTREETDGARRVLRAAAMTYVTAALASAVNMIRLLLIARRTRD